MTDRALVLGGGGSGRIGRLTGMLHGLAEAGVDLSDADVVIGTSAGAVRAAVARAGRTQAKAHAEEIVGTWQR